MTLKDASTWLAFMTACVAVVLRFGALEEAKEIAVQRSADHEARIRAIELDRGTATELVALKVQITKLEGEIRALRAELANDSHRRRR